MPNILQADHQSYPYRLQVTGILFSIKIQPKKTERLVTNQRLSTREEMNFNAHRFAEVHLLCVPSSTSSIVFSLPQLEFN